MRTAKALDRLQRYAERNGVDLDALDADSAAELMIGFFLAEPASDVDPAGGDESDALLFQWGVADTGGESDGTFVYDLTRQFCLDDGGEPRVRHLSLTLHFKARKKVRAVGEGHHWCWGRGAVPELRKQIWSAPATALVRGRRPIRVELSFQDAN